MGINLLHGIIPPLLTPLTEKLELNKEALNHLIEFVIKGGVNGIFLLGTTGEGSSLGRQLRQEVLDVARDRVKGRVPVLVNISSASFLETLQMADAAFGSGADFVVLSPPYYFPMNQAELASYYVQIADHSELPLLIYNAPQYTGNEIATETVLSLSAHENIRGIKDSSGNLEYVEKLLDARQDKDFPVFIGPEPILGQCLLSGCDGGVSGGANIFPGLYVNFYKSAVSRDLPGMKKWQGLMERVQSSIYHNEDSPMGIIIGLKFASSIRGMGSSHMAMPVYGDLSAPRKKKIEDLVAEYEELGF